MLCACVCIVVDCALSAFSVLAAGVHHFATMVFNVLCSSMEECAGPGVQEHVASDMAGCIWSVDHLGERGRHCRIHVALGGGIVHTQMPRLHGNLLDSWKEMCAPMAKHGCLVLFRCYIVQM